MSHLSQRKKRKRHKNFPKNGTLKQLVPAAKGQGSKIHPAVLPCSCSQSVQTRQALNKYGNDALFVYRNSQTTSPWKLCLLDQTLKVYVFFNGRLMIVWADSSESKFKSESEIEIIRNGSKVKKVQGEGTLCREVPYVISAIFPDGSVTLNGPKGITETVTNFPAEMWHSNKWRLKTTFRTDSPPQPGQTLTFRGITRSGKLTHFESLFLSPDLITQRDCLVLLPVKNRDDEGKKIAFQPFTSESSHSAHSDWNANLIATLCCCPNVEPVAPEDYFVLDIAKKEVFRVWPDLNQKLKRKDLTPSKSKFSYLPGENNTDVICYKYTKMTTEELPEYLRNPPPLQGQDLGESKKATKGKKRKGNHSPQSKFQANSQFWLVWKQQHSMYGSDQAVFQAAAFSETPCSPSFSQSFSSKLPLWLEQDHTKFLSETDFSTLRMSNLAKTTNEDANLLASVYYWSLSRAFLPSQVMEHKRLARLHKILASAQVGHRMARVLVNGNCAQEALWEVEVLALREKDQAKVNGKTKERSFNHLLFNPSLLPNQVQRDGNVYLAWHGVTLDPSSFSQLSSIASFGLTLSQSLCKPANGTSQGVGTYLSPDLQEALRYATRTTRRFDVETQTLVTPNSHSNSSSSSTSSSSSSSSSSLTTPSTYRYVFLVAFVPGVACPWGIWEEAREKLIVTTTWDRFGEDSPWHLCIRNPALLHVVALYEIEE